MAEAGHGVDEGDYRRLRRAYIDAYQQSAATNEVLTALGRSSSDPDAVLDTVVESARRLCRCQAAQIYLLEGHQFVLASSVGLSDQYVRYVHDHPFQLDRNTLMGRVTLDRRIQQIRDVLSDPGYGRRDAQQVGGYRTLLSAPLMLDDEVVGALILLRTQVSPFDERAIALLRTFAAQAAVVVRNVNLVHQLEARGAELARKIEQMQALAEVGDMVSSSLVLDQVLSNIIESAVRFSGCDGGSIMEYVEDQRCFSVRSAYATSPALLDRLRGIRVELESTLVGRAAREGRPIAVPDLAEVTLDSHLQLLADDGWRSVLAVPVLRDRRIIGALVVRRRTPGGFTTDTVDFLETFASQSALAVYNAQLFRELQVKSAQLEVASRHKSEFLASMSHELRTPLNAVIGFSEVLLERMFGELNDRQDEYLRDILHSGQHLLELLNEILDLSKVEAGRMELELSTFGLREALDNGLAMVRERAALHGIDLCLQVDPSLDVLESDELRFKQVLLNLLSNAVKFTPDGGHVTLAAQRAGSELAVTVRDDGPGIPPEDQERIFESFQQGRRGAPREEGTGLGLTLSRRIVTLLGGSMWLESELGTGSTFGFTVPLRGAAPASDQPWSSDPAESGDPVEDDPQLPVVVLVDDDRASLDLLSVYLEGLGVRVVRARDGREGLATIRRLTPVAAVLDIRLPGLDGWEVLSQLRSDTATRAVPVIIVSIVDEKSRGMSLGAADYLVKPVGREDLVNSLRRVQALPPTPAEPMPSSCAASEGVTA